MDRAASVAEPVRLRMTAGLDDLAEVRRFVEGAASQGGGDPVAVTDILLALNEAATNIIEHGYLGTPGILEVEVVYEGDAFIVRIRDQGPAFNPAVAPVRAVLPDQVRWLERTRPGQEGCSETMTGSGRPDRPATRF